MALWLYLSSVFDSMRGVLGFYLVMLGIFSIIMIIVILHSATKFDTEINEKGEKYFKQTSYEELPNLEYFCYSAYQFLGKFKWFYLLPITLFLITPSTKTTYLMLGSYIAQNTVEKVGDSELYNKVLKVVDIKLDEVLAETTTKENK